MEYLRAQHARTFSNIIGQASQEPTKYNLCIPNYPIDTHFKLNNIEALKDVIKEYTPKSMFRGELRGIILNTDEDTIIPIASIDNTLPAGSYTVMSATYMRGEVLSEIVFSAVDRLKAARPLNDDQIKSVETQLLTTKFTHASLTQEGSTISIEETTFLATAVANQDAMHTFSDAELGKLVQSTTSSEKEVVEAVNHIQVSQQVHALIKSTRFTEETLLKLHQQLMLRLLTNPQEGMAGEYRKVGIAVHNSKHPRAHSSDVPERMKAWFVTLERGIREGEDITEFLARIHTEFQLIHPFRDGNGRIGRVVMNILALQEGFPVIFFSSAQQELFSKSCETALDGDRQMFRRMLLESFYVSLRAYESAVPNLLS